MNAPRFNKSLSLSTPIVRWCMTLFLVAGLLPFAQAQKKGPKPLPVAEPIVVKVAVVMQDPKIPALGNKRMHELFKTPGYSFQWHDPWKLMEAYRDTLNAVSGGAVRYEIVKVYDDSLFFTRLRGTNELLTMNRVVELLQEPGWETFKKQDAKLDYNAFINHYGFCDMRDKGIINEVWLWSFPYAGAWESTFAGKGAFWLNSNPVEGSSCNELLTIMGLNYEREMSLALESYGHRMESIMRKVYGRWDNKAERLNNWEVFTSYDKQVPQKAHVGNIHFPPNGVKDYDWKNTTKVATAADAWKTYPKLTAAASRVVDCQEWKCTHLGYMTWWMRHVPHFKGINPGDGHLNNWWHYVVDYNGAVKLENQLNKARK